MQTQKNKGSLVFALLMIGLGLWYLAAQFFPVARQLAYEPGSWPNHILAVAAIFALVGLVTWVPGLLIPAAIIGGIGGILSYQNAYNAWETWAFAWTLIPGFVGVGLLLYGLLARRSGAIIGALWTLFASAVLFGIFGGWLGGVRLAGYIWPAALVILGLLLLVGALRRR